MTNIHHTQHFRLFRTSVWLFVSTLVFLPRISAPLFAGTSVIENNIEVSASSGGKVGAQGEARSRIDVETTQNGETLESVHLSMPSSSSTRESFEHFFATTSSAGTIETRIHLEVGASGSANRPSTEPVKASHIEKTKTFSSGPNVNVSPESFLASTTPRISKDEKHIEPLRVRKRVWKTVQRFLFINTLSIKNHVRAIFKN